MSDLPDGQNSQFEEFEQNPFNQPKPARNRTFLILFGIIGGLFVIGLIILLAALLTQGPQQSAQTREQANQINAQNTKVASSATAEQENIIALQKTLEAAAKPPTPTATVPAVAGTPTGVLAMPTATATATATVSSDMATRTAVVGTQIAQGTKNSKGGYPAPGGTQGTPVSGTPGVGTPQGTATTLPQTGIVDQLGLTSLVGLAALLIVVIFVARRARLSAH